MPKNGANVKVQFVLNPQEEPSMSVKKEEPAKAVKKSEGSTDLLSLFEKAIINVNKEIEPTPVTNPESQQARPKLQPIIMKQRRVEDPDGKIVKIQRDKEGLQITHSKLGEGILFENVV